MDDKELTCGMELAKSADVPEKLGALMSHVADNLEAHARSVASELAQHEHDAMLAVAAAYRAIGTAGRDAAQLMRSLASMPPAPHDPTSRDLAAFTAWALSKRRAARASAARTPLRRAR
jgi:hypothetical protein